MPTKASLQPCSQDSCHVHGMPWQCPPTAPIPPHSILSFFLAQNLSSKWIAPTDNMRSKLHDEYTRHQWLKVLITDTKFCFCSVRQHFCSALLAHTHPTMFYITLVFFPKQDNAARSGEHFCIYLLTGTWYFWILFFHLLTLFIANVTVFKWGLLCSKLLLVSSVLTTVQAVVYKNSMY